MDYLHYSDQQLCWRDVEGNFKSLGVVREWDSAYTIYPVSGYCYVLENGVDTTLNYLGEIQIESDNDLLRNRVVPGKKFLKNNVTDTMDASSLGKVIIFKGEIEKIDVDGIKDSKVFNISDVYSITDTGIDFVKFRKLRPESRFELLGRVDKELQP